MILSQICIFLGVFWFLATCWSLSHELFNRRFEFIKRIALCLVLTIAYKCNFGMQFWGLEYEDAFAFHHCAQLMAHGVFPHSFLVEGVAAGSVEQPIAFWTYGGHFIMLPSLLSVFYRLISESFAIFNCFNMVMAFLTMLILSSLNTRCSSGWWVAPLVYCAAPILNVFSLSALCETFSSTVVISYVYFVWRSQENGGRINFVLSCLAFVVAIMTKRENLILFVLPVALWVAGSQKINLKAGIKGLGCYYLWLFFLVIAYFALFQNVVEIEEVEAADIHAPTFSMAYCLRLLPRFLQTICDLRYFSLVFPFVCVSVWFCWGNSHVRSIVIASMLIFASYLLAYSCHYRGYDFVMSGRVDAFDTFRYLNNFTVLLLVPSCFVVLPRIRVQTVVIAVFMLYPLVETIWLRNHMSRVEDRSRFETVRNACMILEQHDNGGKAKILVTDMVLLYQISQPVDFKVCDIRLFDQMKNNVRNVDYYLVLDQPEDIARRYGISVDLSTFEVVGDGLNLECPRVYRFVGLNGANASSTLEQVDELSLHSSHKGTL